MLMDNGQHKTNDSITEGFTAGVGVTPEGFNPLPPEDNLNMDDFEGSHNYGVIGNTALNESLMPDENTGNTISDDSKQLGKIVPLTAPPSTGPTGKANVVISPDGQNESLIDPEIVRHFSGKIGSNEIDYLKMIIKELNPDKLLESIKKVRSVHLSRARGQK